ncbi:MAG: restriction endonuclease subunit S, partial [Patescibacteria group bacterium]
MNNKQQKNILNNWQEVKLKDIGYFTKGSGVSKSELANIGYNAVRYGEIYTRHNIYIKKIYSFISEEAAKNAKEINYGDILFAGSGETIDEIGKSAVYLLRDDCYAGGDIIIFSPQKQNSLFLAFLLNSKIARRQFKKLGQGQSVVHIYKKDLENFNILLPSLPEQKRIVEVLETWDKYLEKLGRKIEVKKNIKKSLMQKLLSGKMRV